MNIRNRKYDLIDENFDEYFFQAIDAMTPEQKERLPNELAAKVRRGASECLNSLNFVQKLHVLTTALGKKWTIFIEDEKGLTYQAFLEVQKGYSAVHSRLDALGGFRKSGGFILGATPLMKRLEYVSLLCATNIYKAIAGYRSEINEKRKRIGQQREVSQSVKGIMTLLIHYESVKYRLKDYGLNSVSDWLVLLYLYEQDEAKPIDLHQMFLYAYSSSRRDRVRSLKNLKALEYIDTRAKVGTVHVKYYLTPKGREIVIKIMERLFLNY